MKVVISVEAEADMEAIGDYVASENPRRAERLVRELRARCIDLRSMPQKFPHVPRFERYGVHRRVHGNYLIFYRIEADQVVVLHVLRGAMDYGALLFPSEELPD